MGGLLNLGIMSLDGLLNRSVARLGSLGLISVDLICNESLNMSALVSWHFLHGLFCNFSACFCLSIAWLLIR